MKAWPILGISIIQAFLFLIHWFLYATVIGFWGSLGPAGNLALQAALFVLGVSFTTAAMIGFFFANRLVTVLYWIASVWLGLLNFFFLAALLCRIYGSAKGPLGLPDNKPLVASVLFLLALAAGAYGMVNARVLRIRRVTVRLPGLPPSWHGRTALVMSDLHLGHLNGPRFARKLVERAAALAPDIIFMPGDVFDGAMADAETLTAPFRQLHPPFGVYYAAGNHDEFGNAEHYAAVLTATGIRVLNNENVLVDGLHIVGVPYGDSTYPIRMKATLDRLRAANGEATILLNHVPNRLPIVEQAGVALMLSGHTHGGQIFPFTWLTRRAFGKFTYGLQRFGDLQVYTSSGAGTWGPPMRVGTHPEMVLLTFE